VRQALRDIPSTQRNFRDDRASRLAPGVTVDDSALHGSEFCNLAVDGYRLSVDSYRLSIAQMHPSASVGFKVRSEVPAAETR
jgi:hypothetical protein